MHPLDQYPNAVLNRIFYFLLEEAPNNCPALIDCPNRARRLAFVSRRWRDLFFPCLFHRVSVALWEPFETQALHVHYCGPSAPLRPFKNLVHHVVLVEHAFPPRRSTNTISQTLEILNTFPCLASVQRDDTNSVPRVFALPASLPTLTAVDIGMVDAYTAQEWLSLPYLNSFAGSLTPGGPPLLQRFAPGFAISNLKLVFMPSLRVADLVSLFARMSNLETLALDGWEVTRWLALLRVHLLHSDIAPYAISPAPIQVRRNPTYDRHTAPPSPRFPKAALPCLKTLRISGNIVHPDCKPCQFDMDLTELLSLAPNLSVLYFSRIDVSHFLATLSLQYRSGEMRILGHAKISG